MRLQYCTIIKEIQIVKETGAKMVNANMKRCYSTYYNI